MADLAVLNDIKHTIDLFISIIKRIMDEEIRIPECAKLTQAQMNALYYIHNHNSSTISSLSDGLSISQPAATMLIDRMYKSGLVTREINSDNRRQTVVKLTDDSKRILGLIDEERTKRLEAILNQMDLDDTAELVRLLNKFVNAAILTSSSNGKFCMKCGNLHNPDCIINQTTL